MSSELRELIREVAGQNPTVGKLYDLAQLVAQATPPESVQEFYIAALQQVIRNVVGNDLRAELNGPSTPNQSHVSAKVRERRSWWATVLAQRVFVDQQMIPLGECGVDDLKVLIEERRRQMAGFAAQIKNFEHLTKLMAKYKVKKVGDLPEQTAWPS